MTLSIGLKEFRLNLPVFRVTKIKDKPEERPSISDQEMVIIRKALGELDEVKMGEKKNIEIWEFE